MVKSNNWWNISKRCGQVQKRWGNEVLEDIAHKFYPLMFHKNNLRVSQPRSKIENFTAIKWLWN